MDKATLIKARENLRGGKNLPLVVYMDNHSTIIDESRQTQLTFWDDENELLYCIRLVNPVLSRMPSNIENCVSVFVTGYDHIQHLEASIVPVGEHLKGILDNMGSIVPDDKKDMIINMYKSILNPNMSSMTNADMNKLVGSNLSENDDYYNGKMVPNREFGLQEHIDAKYGTDETTEEK